MKNPSTLAVEIFPRFTDKDTESHGDGWSRDLNPDLLCSQDSASLSQNIFWVTLGVSTQDP